MAETSPVFRALIVAVDKATPVLEHIGSKIKMTGEEAARAGNPWGPAAQKVSLFTRAANAAHGAAAKLSAMGAPFTRAAGPVKSLAHHVGHLRHQLGEVGEKVTEIVPLLGTLGAAASIAGVFELTHKIAESFSVLNHQALTLGVTAGAIQTLGYVAKMTDTPIESMNTGLFRLNRGIADAAAGKNKDAAGLFHHLGIATRDASGHLISAADVMPRLQEAFRNTTDPAMRARMAMVLFGRGGKEMLPFLMASKEDMAAWSDQASRMVYPFTKEDGENLEAFKRGWVGLTAAGQGFLDEIGAKLAPVLTPVVDKIANWVASNRDWLSTNITDAVRSLADAVMKIDFGQVVKDTKAWLSAAGDLLDKVGGLKTVIIALAGFMAAPWLAAAASFLKTLAEIAGAAVRAAWAIGTALVTALDGAEKKMALFNATALKNPLFRAAMIAANLYDKVTTDPTANVSQEDLNKADPAKLTAAGYTKNSDGRWEKNGTEAPSGNRFFGFETPEWMREPMGWGGSFGGFSVPPGFGEPSGLGVDGGLPSPTAINRLPGALGGGGQSGKVDVKVTIDGAPPGTTVRATGSGIASDPQTDVGYAFPGMIPAQ